MFSSGIWREAGNLFIWRCGLEMNIWSISGVNIWWSGFKSNSRWRDHWHQMTRSPTPDRVWRIQMGFGHLELVSWIWCRGSDRSRPSYLAIWCCDKGHLEPRIWLSGAGDLVIWCRWSGFETRSQNYNGSKYFFD